MTILNGLTLDGFVQVGTGSNYYGYLDFVGTQSLSGTGSIAFDNSNYNTVRVRDSGTTLTIGPGITIHGVNGSVGYNPLLSGSHNDVAVIDHGTVSGDIAGGTIILRADNGFTATGLKASGGGTLNLTGTFALQGSAFLESLPGGTISVSGDLVGGTRDADLFKPLGQVLMNGNGTAAAPQRLEVMSQDLRAGQAALTKNFAYGTLSLGPNTYVLLVDDSHNSSGSGAEALYVNALVVPHGSTLALNGLHVYAHTSQIAGTVVGGTITQLQGGGEIGLGAPAAGDILSPTTGDDWTFFGRASQSVTVTVNTGSGASTPPIQPYLNYAQIQVVDASGNVLASASNVQAGADITLPAVALPADGVYHIQITAPSGHPSSIGNYVLSVWDATVHSFTTNLNQVSYGQIASPYNVDQWTFSALANEQVRFDFLNSASSQFRFDLSGPAGFVGFSGLSTTSDPVTLPTSGSYILTAYTVQGATGAYTFRLRDVRLIGRPIWRIRNLLPGVAGGQRPGPALQDRCHAISGSAGYAPGSLEADQNELYLKFGAPPTRTDYQFRFSNGAAANQQVLVPSATPGSWYALLYATSVPQPSTYTILVTTSDVFLTGSTPSRSGTGVDTTLTLTGSGFDQTTSVDLVGTNGTVYPATSSSIDLPTQITATFAARSVPAGVYTVEVSKPGVQPARLSNALTIDQGGGANLKTDIVVPSFLGRHALGTIYVDYANTGDVAMPAPLLTLTGTQNPLLTLDSSRLAYGLFTSALPDGFSHSIEMLGGGATPGVLQPGETIRVPVYYAGLQRPWDFSQSGISFNLSVTTTGNATPIDWSSLKDGLRPPYIDPTTWSALYPGLTAQIGSTWGDFVRRIDADATYLGQLGEKVNDLSQLWQFEIRQAIGLNPVRQIASNVDVSVPAPGFPLTFSRSYSPSILDRSVLGPLGMGWSLDGGWQRTLTKLSDGTVVVADTGGAIRRFQPDSRNSSYFDQPGDHGVLIANPDGTFSLRETNGTLTHFLA